MIDIIPDADILTAVGTIIGAVLVFIGGVIGVWATVKHNKVTNELQVRDLQIKMIDQLQEERNHTEELLKEERRLRAEDISKINARFEKYKDRVAADKAIDRQHIRNLTEHINLQLPPPPPEPPDGYKP